MLGLASLPRRELARASDALRPLAGSEWQQRMPPGSAGRSQAWAGEPWSSAMAETLAAWMTGAFAGQGRLRPHWLAECGQGAGVSALAMARGHAASAVCAALRPRCGIGPAKGTPIEDRSSAGRERIPHLPSHGMLASYAPCNIRAARPSALQGGQGGGMYGSIGVCLKMRLHCRQGEVAGKLGGGLWRRAEVSCIALSTGIDAGCKEVRGGVRTDVE